MLAADNSHSNSLSNSGHSLDLDKLATVVAKAETGGCKDGTAIKKKNCFGIMKFWTVAGVRHRTAKTYTHVDESFAEFKKIWAKSYKTYPTKALALKWTGGDASCRWLRTVEIGYSGSSNRKCNEKTGAFL